LPSPNKLKVDDTVKHKPSIFIQLVCLRELPNKFLPVKKDSCTRSLKSDSG